jgi:hypothetical protein
MAKRAVPPGLCEVPCLMAPAAIRERIREAVRTPVRGLWRAQGLVTRALSSEAEPAAGAAAASE